MNSIRRIAHLDMDAFFASVELLRYPELRGLPVVVGGRDIHQPIDLPDGSRRFFRLRDYAGRGVVTTSTYPARELGVFSGMGLMQSARLAPEAILLPADFRAYRDASQRFKAAVAAVAPRIEDRGIDEIYIDLSAVPGETMQLARRLRQAVLDATGLSCSIGIAPNKLLAKLGSDLDKPGGITVLAADDLPARVWPLPVRKLNGIGPRSAERLAGMGIQCIGDLAGTPPGQLVARFGPAIGEWMHRAACGIDERPVLTWSEPKSVSRESTFEQDLHPARDREALSGIFSALCLRVADDLQRKGYAGHTVGIKLRYADFTSVTRDATLATCVREGADIRRAAGKCLRRVPLTQKIRLLGVRVSGLVPVARLVPARDGPAQLRLPF